ncbi:hypothetical protein SDC9_152450 [bioreactor metagenome]|uniref:Uncharacterized protein n=1 Tax=bioreactor metagenome TaxID=1076179 RepID=A0A645EUR6_9ZZZZ
MVNRHIEKALNLIGMQVHGDQSADARSTEHISNQFRSDAHARFIFPVLTRPSEIRDNRDNGLR